MSTITLRAPRAFSLPRVKFKRPRWPRGKRLYLAVAVMNFSVAVYDLLLAAFGVDTTANLAFATLNALAGVWNGYSWWRSRSDDDGPSAT